MLYIVVVIPLLAFFCFNFRKSFRANTSAQMAAINCSLQNIGSEVGSLRDIMIYNKYLEN